MSFDRYMSYLDLGYPSYEHYLMSDWFRDLTEQLIYENAKAACFICGGNVPGSFLLLHHIDYSSLGREKIGRDIFILCAFCHKRAHFRMFLFFFKRKVSLTKKDLKKRLYFLKVKSCVQKRRFDLVLWYSFKYMS